MAGADVADGMDAVPGDMAEMRLEGASGGNAGGTLLAEVGSAAACCMPEAGPVLVTVSVIGPMEEGLLNS